MLAASFAIGVTTVVPQLILPFAAGLTPPAMRGRVVGQVVSGLLVGILAGRAVAGVVTDLAGWRTMYFAASVAMLALALSLRAMLPVAPAPLAASYGTLVRSMGTLFRREPVIRDAALLGALGFASFSAFWTTLAFRLQAGGDAGGTGLQPGAGLRTADGGAQPAQHDLHGVPLHRGQRRLGARRRRVGRLPLEGRVRRRPHGPGPRIRRVLRSTQSARPVTSRTTSDATLS